MASKLPIRVAGEVALKSWGDGGDDYFMGQGGQWLEPENVAEEGQTEQLACRESDAGRHLVAINQIGESLADPLGDLASEELLDESTGQPVGQGAAEERRQYRPSFRVVPGRQERVGQSLSETLWRTSGDFSMRSTGLSGNCTAARKSCSLVPK